MTPPRRNRSDTASPHDGDADDSSSAQQPGQNDQQAAEVGEPPGSLGYFGGGGSTPGGQGEQSGSEVGDPPGSPAYYGQRGGAGENETGQSTYDVGQPVGSAAYFGLDSPQVSIAGAQMGGQAAEELPLQSLGVPPGGSGYYGSLESGGADQIGGYPPPGDQPPQYSR